MKKKVFYNDIPYRKHRTKASYPLCLVDDILHKTSSPVHALLYVIEFGLQLLLF